jgi:hypothetical protein
MAVTETWQIIDQRMDIFRLAIVAALYDVDAAHHAYFNAAYHAMPIAFPKDAWTPPTEEMLRKIETLGDALINSLMTLQSYIFDFLREMQTLLVGAMFDQRIPPASRSTLPLWSCGSTDTPNYRRTSGSKATGAAIKPRSKLTCAPVGKLSRKTDNLLLENHRAHGGCCTGPTIPRAAK